MTSPGSDPITDDAPEDVAASFVLGLLEADAWVLAANRCASDPAFADEVEAWEARLTPLALAVDSQLPSRDLWPDVLRRLPANSGAGVRASLALWRGLTAAAGFIAVACLTFVMLEGRPDANKAMTPGPSPPIGPVAETVPSEPLQVALLKPEQGPTAFVVEHVTSSWKEKDALHLPKDLPTVLDVHNRLVRAAQAMVEASSFADRAGTR